MTCLNEETLYDFAKRYVMKISFIVNDKPYSVDAPPMKRLLDVLREDLRLTGMKGCCAIWNVRLNIFDNICKIQNLCYIQA